MTQLPQPFNPNDYNPQGPSEGNLPVSDKHGHVVTIVDSEMKPTKDNQGTMLVLTLEIQQGEHQGQQGPYRLNIGNNSADAVRIALSQLSAICHVIGYLQPLTDVSVLYNKPFRVIVSQQNNAEGREKGYTEIKGVLDVHGNKPGKASTGQQSQGGPAPGPMAPPPPPQQFPQQPPQNAPQQQFPQQPPQQPQGFPQAPQGQQQPQQQAFPQQGQPGAPQQPQYAPQQQPNPSNAPWNQTAQQ